MVGNDEDDGDGIMDIRQGEKRSWLIITHVWSMYLVFKIENLKPSYEFPFEGLSNLSSSVWRVGSNPRRQSENLKIKIQNSYQTCAWIICYMFPIQCEELRISHLTLLLVVTAPYTCWFLWRAYYVEDFKWPVFICNLGLHFEGLFWERYILKGQIMFEGFWRLQSWTLHALMHHTSMFVVKFSLPITSTHQTVHNIIAYNITVGDWELNLNPESPCASFQASNCSIF